MPRKGENIYKRSDGLWEARYVKGFNEYGKKVYGSVYSRSYTEVKEKRQNKIIQTAFKPKTSSTKRSLNELIEEWLFLNKNRLKRSTYQKYVSFYNNHIKNELGNLPLLHLSPTIIQNFATSRLNIGLSEKTINSILVFVHTCLKYGNRQYHHPMVEIVYLKQSAKQMRVLSVNEQKLLVEYLTINQDIYKLGTLLALYTGIRIGELCALKWENIKDDTISIISTMQRGKSLIGNGTELYVGEPKTKTSIRTIPIPTFLKEAITKARLSDEKHFLSNTKTSIVEPRLLQYYFQKYMKDLSFPKTNFHALRHTFATRCIECGCDVKTLSEILGHSNVGTTLNLYVHSSEQLKKKNIDKLKYFL